MILPFQNLKVMLNTSRDSTITPGGLISNRRLSTLSTLLPLTVSTLSTMFWIEPCDDRNIATPSVLSFSFHWEVIFLWKETTWSTFALITGTIIDIFNVVFTPFYLLKPVLQAIYKFWVWKKKQGPWPKLEKCMKINTCKCIYIYAGFIQSLEFLKKS